MSRVRRAITGAYAGNASALVGAMVALSVATLVVARLDGPAAVGNYALLRMLPWLVALLATAGLPASITYFLAGPTRDDPRIKPTLALIAGIGAVGGTVGWLVATPLLQRYLLTTVPIAIVAVAALKVPVRLAVITSKASAQGSNDLRGSNIAIFLEEASFLPLYLALLAMRLSSPAAIVGALILADVVTAAALWSRLARRGFFTAWSSPSLALTKRVYAFAARGQLGGLMNLLNLRLDFLILDALAGPAALGVYAVATKYAEVVRLVSITSNWVLYPRFASHDAAEAAARARWLAPRALGLTALASAVLGVAAALVIPLLYGDRFIPAVLPARLLFLGLFADGAAGVLTAYLYGRGRPGLTSVGTGAGLLVTLGLDLALIPRLGAGGAAIASSAAYLTTTAVLIVAFFVLNRAPAAGIGPGHARRALDVAVAATLLVIAAPVLGLLVAAAAHSTGASGIYRQRRVGQGGRTFEVLKIRSMRPADGPDVTAPDDARVTEFGQFIRRTSLDELPQLLNVLRGEMTLVGPRPETLRLAEAYPPELREVFQHRPGLTGPVQVMMREHDVLAGLDAAAAEGYYLDVLVPRRVELDLAFLRRATFRRTLILLAATALHVAGFRASGGSAARATVTP